MVEMLESAAQKKFGMAKRDRLPRHCLECHVVAMCNGGCPKDRFMKTPDGEEGLNYLCGGFKRFFTHSRPYFLQMASLERAGEPMERLAGFIRSVDAKPSLYAGRNDPCPCGSGRKYKKCCLGEQYARNL